MEQRDQDYSRHLAKSSDDALVFVILSESVCAKCHARVAGGDMLSIREGKALCIACSGMGDLVLLPSGDPALTRRASKLSARRAVVLKWARANKRYQRQGTLVEASAIEAARALCAADAQKREAKSGKAAIKREIEDVAYHAAFLSQLKRLFPGCPEQEASEIAVHACEKHSGRVGRSAAAKELDADKIRLAVVAHIRHIHTGYDQFFDIDVAKRDARRMVQAKITRVLSSWESPAPMASTCAVSVAEDA